MGDAYTYDKLAATLYLLLRDHVTFGEIEKVLLELEKSHDGWALEDEHLGLYVEKLSRRILGCK